MRALTFLRFVVCGALLLAHGHTTFGNNISVGNTTLGAQNQSDQTVAITFDVAWENSWRTSNNEANYDGAWIFVKYRVNGTSDWRHCTLAPAQFTAGTGATIVVSSDSMGAFIHRSTNGIGNVNFNGNTLSWHYGADGVINGDNVQIRLFALEMVYIPEGEYYLGSGGSEVNCFKNGNSASAFLVEGPGAIQTGTNAGDLNLNGQGTNGTVIPAGYPNGFNAFWIMKYECSQQQFADFLNHLTSVQAAANNTSTNFAGSSHPAFTPLVADRAYNNLSVAQATAFADWAGLRPYSELEFEKACRGKSILPVPNEYPWGTTAAVRMESNQFSNAGQPDEAVLTGVLANAAYRNSNSSGNGTGRPVRVGIFARSTGSGRELSGATYYGVLNMGDNLIELTIRAGTAIGQSVDAATHGDGHLRAAGATDITTWQTSAFGGRGTHYASPAGSMGHMRVSDRDNMDSNVGSTSAAYGIRLARTAN
ncbi:MAG: SUMF1/EgtB/PvdO family nonheme iron enzyme [Flavobacteriales bacterium]|nr:SUMF1/EgtB/PvdO family nonheme iron enzyme [Flavobacteriales bacterium]MEB2341364.1 SUMF1/EgtB/PvdO family nonheme iron enzyme [Flavobacteriia bacterium]